MNGWIKIHRKILDWGWYDDSNMVHLFVDLLLNANSLDANWRVLHVPKGSLVTSLDKLSERTGISIRTIRTCLKRLEDGGEISQKTTNKYRVITVTNYVTYQVETTSKRQTTDNQTTSKRQTTDNKQEYKEGKNIRNKEKKELPKGNSQKKFVKPTIDQVSAYCKERGNGIDPQRFIDHYEANGWLRGKSSMKDWKAAVRTWEYNQKDKNHGRSKTGTPIDAGSFD